MGRALKAALLLAGIVASFQAGRVKGCAESLKFMLDRGAVDSFSVNDGEVIVTSKFKVKEVVKETQEVDDESDN